LALIVTSKSHPVALSAHRRQKSALYVTRLHLGCAIFKLTEWIHLCCVWADQNCARPSAELLNSPPKDYLFFRWWFL